VYVCAIEAKAVTIMTDKSSSIPHNCGHICEPNCLMLMLYVCTNFLCCGHMSCLVSKLRLELHPSEQHDGRVGNNYSMLQTRRQEDVSACPSY